MKIKTNHSSNVIIIKNGMSDNMGSTFKKFKGPGLILEYSITVATSSWSKKLHRPSIQSNKFLVQMTSLPVGTLRSQRRKTRSIASASTECLN